MPDTVLSAGATVVKIAGAGAPGRVTGVQKWGYKGSEQMEAQWGRQHGGMTLSRAPACEGE